MAETGVSLRVNQERVGFGEKSFLGWLEGPLVTDIMASVSGTQRRVWRQSIEACADFHKVFQHFRFRPFDTEVNPRYIWIFRWCGKHRRLDGQGTCS